MSCAADVWYTCITIVIAGYRWIRTDEAVPFFFSFLLPPCVCRRRTPRLRDPAVPAQLQLTVRFSDEETVNGCACVCRFGPVPERRKLTCADGVVAHLQRQAVTRVASLGSHVLGERARD